MLGRFSRKQHYISLGLVEGEVIFGGNIGNHFALVFGTLSGRGNSSYIQIHTHARFPWSKTWPTYHVAVPTGNALALQRSIFRENRLKFLTFIRR